MNSAIDLQKLQQQIRVFVRGLSVVRSCVPISDASGMVVFGSIAIHHISKETICSRTFCCCERTFP